MKIKKYPTIFSYDEDFYVDIVKDRSTIKQRLRAIKNNRAEKSNKLLSIL